MESENRALVNLSVEGQKNGQIISRGDNLSTMITNEYQKLKRTREEARLMEYLEEGDAMPLDEIADNESENQDDKDVIVVELPQAKRPKQTHGGLDDVFEMADKFHETSKELLKGRFQKVASEAKANTQKALRKCRATTKAEITALKNEVEQLRQELAMANVEAGLAHQANLNLGALSAKYGNLEKAHKALKREFDQTKKEVSNYEEVRSQLATIQEKYGELREDYASLERDWEASETQLELLREEIKDFGESMEIYKAKSRQLDAVNATLNKLQVEHEALQDVCRKLDKDLEITKARATAALGSTSDQLKLKQLQLQYKALEKNLERAQDCMKQADESVEAAERAARQNEKLRKTLHAYAAEIESLQKQQEIQKEANSILMEEAAARKSGFTKEEVQTMKKEHELQLATARKGARAAQITEQFNAQKLLVVERIAEWDLWAMSPRFVLNERRGFVDSGPNCERKNVKCGLEIIRRSDPQDPLLRWYVIVKPQEKMELVKYPFRDADATPDPHNSLASLRKTLQKEGNLNFEGAKTIAGAWLRYQRDLVLVVIRSHPYYQDQLNEKKVKIEQECVKFFDRRLLFQIQKLVGVKKLRQFPLNCQNKSLRLGGTQATLVFYNLDVGPYDDYYELDKMNVETWKALNF